jgi:hypothetical protein
MFSDFGTAFGSFGLKFNVGMTKIIKGDEPLVSGTVKFTFADTYRWQKGRQSAATLIGIGDHDKMVLLKDIGAKEFSIRTFFTSKFTFKDAFWTFNQLEKTKTEDLKNDCNNECYPEISPGKGYSLKPGGEKADYRPQN